MMQVLEQTGGIPDYYKDYKDLLDRPDIHAVIIGCVVGHGGGLGPVVHG
mgnify:CR=1 FL=1